MEDVTIIRTCLTLLACSCLTGVEIKVIQWVTTPARTVLVSRLPLSSQDIRGSNPSVETMLFPLFLSSLIIHEGHIYTPPAAKV